MSDRNIHDEKRILIDKYSKLLSEDTKALVSKYNDRTAATAVNSILITLLTKSLSVWMRKWNEEFHDDYINSVISFIEHDAKEQYKNQSETKEGGIDERL